jgi:hypothetical protein
MSARNEPRQTQPKFTEYVRDATGVECSRCHRQAFQMGTSFKKFGDRVRDEYLWRIVGGSLVCLDCLLVVVRQWVLSKPGGRQVSIEDESGRMRVVDIYTDGKCLLVEYDGEPPESITLVNSQRRITIDARWLDHLLGRVR